MRDCMGKCGDFCEILPLPKASHIYGRLRKQGGETHALLTCSTRVRLGTSYHINSVFVDYGDEHDGFSFFSRSIAGCPRR